ncbi:hypothetical protein IAQ61_001862 [Plenodomus lingam]|uniref:uncharacterized protein n=1 Tax=Leptosphaeria maculans TaxID=5022 RepID=UPI0033310F0C|nr:hypothetical protein IAQ61_001862 [Plenodomus lingam]
MKLWWVMTLILGKGFKLPMLISKPGVEKDLNANLSSDPVGTARFPTVDQVTGALRSTGTSEQNRRDRDSWCKIETGGVMSSQYSTRDPSHATAISDSVSADANSMESPVESPGGVSHRVVRQSGIWGRRG